MTKGRPRLDCRGGLIDFGQIVLHDSAVGSGAVAFQGVDIAGGTLTKFRDVVYEGGVFVVERHVAYLQMGLKMRGVGGTYDCGGDGGTVEDVSGGYGCYVGLVLLSDFIEH